MDKIILYSTGCPKCKMLEKRLKDYNVEYEENNDVNYMLNRKIMSVPVLEINGTLFNFAQAWKLIEGLNGNQN